MTLHRIRPVLLAYIPVHILLYTIWLYIWQDDQWMKVLGGNTFSTLGPIIAVICLFQTYRRVQDETKKFWLFVAVGVLSFTIGELIWLGYEWFLQVEVPFPSLADLFYLLQPLCHLGGVLYLMYLKKNTYRMVRLLFDSLIVMTVATSLSWQFIIQPGLGQAESGWLYTMAFTAYPVFDLALLFGTVSLYLASKSFSRTTSALLFTGILLFICVDTAYFYMLAQGLYSSGSFFDPLWTMALLLLGASGLYYQPSESVTSSLPQANDAQTPPRFTARLFLPYLSLILLFVVMIMRMEQIDSIVIGAAIAMSLVIVRQILTLLENDQLLHKLHQMNEDLEHKVEQRTLELSEKNAELTEALRVKDDFMAVISHELRTPLHGILGYVELIENEEDGPISQELRDDLQIIRRSSNRLLHLVEDILSFSKIQNGKEQLLSEPIKVAQLLDHLALDMQCFSQEKGIALRVTCEPEVGTVLTDPMKLEQILINLVKNAIKFTDQGTVAIHATKHARMLELAVHDTGIGIPSDYHRHIFEPFTQVDGSSTRRYSGTGLGLAIVKNLVDLLHGEIALESEPGVGSVFTVRIPVQWPDSLRVSAHHPAHYVE